MKRLGRKEIVYLRGERAQTLYRLEEGLVRIVEFLPDGRSSPCATSCRGTTSGRRPWRGRPTATPPRP